jgi:L-threonylcarbamoyladenylate synthase
VPDHTIARDLIKAFGKPLVAPSANRSGHVSPTLAEHVRADLDGRMISSSTRSCEHRRGSTIVSCLACRSRRTLAACRAMRSSACSVTP